MILREKSETEISYGEKWERLLLFIAGFGLCPVFSVDTLVFIDQADK